MRLPHVGMYRSKSHLRLRRRLLKFRTERWAPNSLGVFGLWTESIVGSEWNRRCAIKSDSMLRLPTVISFSHLPSRSTHDWFNDWEVVMLGRFTPYLVESRPLGGIDLESKRIVCTQSMSRWDCSMNSVFRRVESIWSDADWIVAVTRQQSSLTVSRTIGVFKSPWVVFVCHGDWAIGSGSCFCSFHCAYIDIERRQCAEFKCRVGIVRSAAFQEAKRTPKHSQSE